MSKPKSKQKQIQECLDTLSKLMKENGTPALIIASYDKDTVFRYIAGKESIFQMVMAAAMDSNIVSCDIKALILSVASNIIMDNEELKRIFADMVNGTKYEEILSGVDKSLLN